MQWSEVSVDKHSPVPLYYQLAELIRECITAGTLQPGEQLPSERELGERLGISRMTARQALAYLIRSGTLVARSGIGTFVAEPKVTYDALHLLGFTEEMVRQGGIVISHVLQQECVVPPPRVAARLQLRDGDTATTIVRLRLMQNAPLLLETIFVPSALCPGLERAELARHSLYSLLEQHYALRLSRSHHTLEATIANQYESSLFGVPAGTPMILLEGVTYVEQGIPTAYFKAVYRGDRLKFELESRRDLVEQFVATPRLSLRLP
jgi:GntR family transcriptional regulator